MPPGAPGPVGERLPGHAQVTKGEIQQLLNVEAPETTNLKAWQGVCAQPSPSCPIEFCDFQHFRGTLFPTQHRAPMPGPDSEAPTMNTRHFLRVLTAILSIAFADPASAQCAGDLTNNGIVDGADIGLLLSNWGPCGSSCLYDLNNDGKVNGADLGILLANWGPCPIPTWGIVIEAQPDPSVVTDPMLRAAIQATGLPWRVRDTDTQMEMLLVPPGTFIMGSGKWGYHQVTLTKAFYLGRYEVTQAQWVAKMGSNPSGGQGQPDSASRPVENVRWDTIQSYLNATGFRLPTEAEWEYACRAGTQTPYYDGSTDDSTLGNLAWYRLSSGVRTHPVGGKAPNGFGLYDMLGNVWECVNDWMGAYPGGAQTDPTGPAGGTNRVVRGGDCCTPWGYPTSSLRDWDTFNVGIYVTGIRVARNP
jgi:formylglycine-generating enzyme required for sulfatase activity